MEITLAGNDEKSASTSTAEEDHAALDQAIPEFYRCNPSVEASSEGNPGSLVRRSFMDEKQQL